MSDFLAAEGIPTLDRLRAEHITGDLDLVVVGNAISRGNSGARGGARSQDPLLLAARGDSRSLPLGRAVDRHRRHARQDDDDVADRVAADARRRRSERARRRHRAQLRRARLELPHRAGPRLRHRGRRVRQRVLRQDGEVPEVPARHRRHQQRRVRPRGHLRRLRRGDAGVPAAREPGAAARPAAARRRQPGARALRGDGACRASRRSALATTSTGRRTTSSRRGASTRFSVRRARRAVRRRSRCRCSARTTCATRWPRSPWRPRSASAPSGSPRACGRSRASSGGSKIVGVGRRRDGLRRLRAPSDRRRRDAGGAARVAIRTRGSGRCSSRGRPRRAGACFRTTSRARSRGADEVLIAPVFRSTLPEAERLSVPQLVRDLRARGQSRARGRRRSTTSSTPSSREHRPGDLVVLMSNGGFGGIHQKLLQALGVSARIRIVPAGDSALIVEFDERIDPGVNARAIALAEPIAGGAARRRPRRRADLSIGGGLLRSAADRRTTRLCALLDARPRATAPRRRPAPAPIRDSGVLRRRARPRSRRTSRRSRGMTPRRGRRAAHGARLSRVHARLRAGLRVHGRRRRADRRCRGARRRACACRPARSASPACRRAIYPAETPGGWQIIGRTPVEAVRPVARRAVPAEGRRRVQFYPIDRASSTSRRARTDAA